MESNIQNVKLFLGDSLAKLHLMKVSKGQKIGA